MAVVMSSYKIHERFTLVLIISSKELISGLKNSSYSSVSDDATYIIIM